MFTDVRWCAYLLVRRTAQYPAALGDTLRTRDARGMLAGFSRGRARRLATTVRSGSHLGACSLARAQVGPRAVSETSASVRPGAAAELTLQALPTSGPAGHSLQSAAWFVLGDWGDVDAADLGGGSDDSLRSGIEVGSALVVAVGANPQRRAIGRDPGLGLPGTVPWPTRGESGATPGESFDCRKPIE